MFRTESELNVWLLYCTARGLVIILTILEPVWYGMLSTMLSMKRILFGNLYTTPDFY